MSECRGNRTCGCMIVVKMDQGDFGLARRGRASQRAQFLVMIVCPIEFEADELCSMCLGRGKGIVSFVCSYERSRRHCAACSNRKRRIARIGRNIRVVLLSRMAMVVFARRRFEPSTFPPGLGKRTIIALPCLYRFALSIPRFHAKKRDAVRRIAKHDSAC